MIRFKRAPTDFENRSKATKLQSQSFVSTRGWKEKLQPHGCFLTTPKKTSQQVLSPVVVEEEEEEVVVVVVVVSGQPSLCKTST